MIVRWLIRLCVALAVIALANGELPNLNTVLNRRNITEKTGMACAYADFDQDRNIDILHYYKGKLYVLLQITETILGAKDFTDVNSTDTAQWTIDLGEEYAEVACSVGDINYDGLTDVVVSTKKSKDSKHWTVRYFYTTVAPTTNSSRFVQGDKIIKAKHQVALIDVTGDGIHDLVGIQEDGENLLCLRGDEHDILTKPCERIFVNWTGSLHPLMPIIFGDVNNDRYADLVFMKYDETTGLKPEIWSRDGDKEWIMKPDMQLPEPPTGVSFKHTLAPLLFDYNLDAKMDIVVPVCKDKTCTTIENVQAICYEGGNGWKEWKTIPIDLGQGNTIVEEEDTLVRMKAGDVNLDGYPDLLVTIGTVHGGNNYAALLESKPGEGGKWKFERPEAMLVMPGLALGMIQSSSFFDFAEDGNLDILVQWKLRDGDDWQWSLCLSDMEKHDVTFLKVQTFAPLKTGSIMDKTDAKGVVWGGACVTYEMETTGIGEKRKAIECQVPANSHKAGLSPPFVLFGLGRNPNFIDEAEIGVPRSGVETSGNKEERYHVQKQIVPNARMMVQPPHEGGRSWVLRLFLTPSSLIFSSLIVMAAVCVILLIVVIILHYREKKVDRVERAAQSHRFHFDAM